MGDDRLLEEAIEKLTAALRAMPGVLMVADDADERGSPRILVVLRVGIDRPSELPDAFEGFPVVVEHTPDIIAHEGPPKA